MFKRHWQWARSHSSWLGCLRWHHWRGHSDHVGCVRPCYWCRDWHGCGTDSIGAFSVSFFLITLILSWNVRGLGCPKKHHRIREYSKLHFFCGCRPFARIQNCFPFAFLFSLFMWQSYYWLEWTWFSGLCWWATYWMVWWHLWMVFLNSWRVSLVCKTSQT